MRMRGAALLSIQLELLSALESQPYFSRAPLFVLFHSTGLSLSRPGRDDEYAQKVTHKHLVV